MHPGTGLWKPLHPHQRREPLAAPYSLTASPCQAPPHPTPPHKPPHPTHNSTSRRCFHLCSREHHTPPPACTPPSFTPFFCRPRGGCRPAGGACRLSGLQGVQQDGVPVRGGALPAARGRAAAGAAPAAAACGAAGEAAAAWVWAGGMDPAGAGREVSCTCNNRADAWHEVALLSAHRLMPESGPHPVPQDCRNFKLSYCLNLNTFFPTLARRARTWACSRHGRRAGTCSSL